MAFRLPRVFRATSFFVLLLAVALVCGGQWWLSRGRWRTDALPVSTGQTPAYANKVDPNTAPWQELACLPGIGERKAQDIVSYRKAHAAAGPAFNSPADLTRVKGIGVKTADRIAPFLSFPTTGPEEE